MEIHKAKINRADDKTTLVFILGENTLEIILTEDRPLDIKNVFNRLISELKKGEFNFELEDYSEDLYYYICFEYIEQLNAELSSVYKELKDYELLDKEEE